MAGTKKRVDIFINGKQAGTTINDLRKESRRLNSEINQLTPGTEAYRRKVKQLSTVNKTLTDHRKKIRGIGGAFSNLKGKVGGFAKSFMGPLGVIGLIGGAFAAVGQWVRKNKQLQKSLSSLRSLTGASTADLKVYKKEAIAIGSVSVLSANQVVEGFKLIGSAKPELLANKEALIAVTKEAIILAEASEQELAPAAQSLAGTLNQFNLRADESRRVINALAAGSKAGAADIPTLTESMDKTGTVAASMNVSLEQNIALLETLAEKNIKGAEAGTKLKNVLLIMSTLPALSPAALAQLEKYGVDIDLVADKTVPFQERLKELSKISEDSTALVKVFGKENLVVGQTLLQNADKVQSYTDAVTGTNTATEQQLLNNDNLDGDLKSLGSAWDGFILSMSSGNSVLRQVVQWLIALLNVMSGNGSILDIMPDWITQMVEMTDSIDNFKNAIIDLGKWMLTLIPGGKTLIKVMDSLFESTEKLTAEQRRANKITAAAIKNGKEILQQNKDEISDISVLIDALADKNTTREEELQIIAKLNKDYPEFVKNIDLETASTARLMEIKKQLITQILTEAIERKKAEALANITAQIIDLELRKIGAGKSAIEEINRQIKGLTLILPMVLEIAEKVGGELEKTVAGLDLSAPFRENLSEIDKINQIILKLQEKLNGELTDQERERTEKMLSNKQLQLSKLLDLRKRSLDEALDIESDITELTEDEIAARSEAREKELDDLLKSLKKLQEAVDQFEKDAADRAIIAGESDAEAKELAALKIQVDKKFQIQIAEAERLAAVQGEIGEKAQLELDTLLLLKKQELEQGKSDIADKFRLIEEEKENAFFAKLKAQAISLKQAELDIRLLKVSEAIQAEIDMQGFASKALHEEMTAILIERLVLETQLKQETLDQQLLNEEITLEEFDIRKEQLEIEHQSRKTDIVKQGEAERLAEVISNVQKGLDVATKALSIFDDISATIHQVKLNRINKEKNASIKALREQLNAGIITEEEFQRKKGKIEADAARNSAQEIHKQAVFAKALALIQAAINTAVGVTSAIPNIPLMILAGIAGAAQIAVIASKPIPQAKKGGMKVVGADDGITYNADFIGKHPGGMLPSTPVVLASEVGPEYYVPNALLSQPRVAKHIGIIEAIRTNQMQDGGFTQAAADADTTGADLTGTQAAQTNRTLESLNQTIGVLNGKLDTLKAKIDDATVDDISAKQQELADIKSAS